MRSRAGKWRTPATIECDNAGEGEFPAFVFYGHPAHLLLFAKVGTSRSHFFSSVPSAILQN